MEELVPHNSTELLKSRRKMWIILAILFILVGAGVFGMIMYAKSYEDRVFPGVHIGGVSVGGMTSTELREYLYSMNNKLVDAGIHIHFTEGNEEKEMIIPPTIVNDNVVDLVYMDVEKEVEEIFSRQKDDHILLRMWRGLYSKAINPDVELKHVTIDTERLFPELENRLAPYETKVKNASVAITSVEPLQYEMTSSSPGVVFDYTDIAKEIVSSWSRLTTPNIFIKRLATDPNILEKDLFPLMSRIPKIFDARELTLTYTDPHTKRDYDWVIGKKMIGTWIESQEQGNGDVGFGLSASSTKSFLEHDIAEQINVEAESARFAVAEGGKVSEFQGSRPGIALDIDATYTALNGAILERTWRDAGMTTSMPVVVKQVEPDVQTGQVNDLGIKEVLGVGYSNYGGSPPNRIKNIRHAIHDKLNGLLIKPGEDFSLLNAVKPFTMEDGYLPELVIKGDKIEPEIGGGLCQIGSTMFRAAMNAGMPITERRNHSLVVTYYNDPRNGNPGTDATIYDPAPDFRFLNDTGNYMLLTTEMNERTGDLTFTLWGTNDGRKGSYTKPVVLRWIPSGPPKDVPTAELAPGQKKCQNAHPGAVASFTYVRELPNGEKIERVFESYYRPLPTICLVGVDPNAVPERTCEILPTGEESCTTPGEPVASAEPVVQPEAVLVE